MKSNRKTKGVSGIIGLIFILAAFVIGMSLMILMIQSSITIQRGEQTLIQKQRESLGIRSSVEGVWRYRQALERLEVNITNNYREPVILDRLTIIFPNGEYKITSSYNILIGSGDTISIQATGISEKPSVVMADFLTPTTSATVELKEYTITNVTGVTPNYTLENAPVLIDNYTTSVIGFNSTLSSPQSPTGYSILQGTLISSSPLTVNASYVNTYVFPDYSGWRYYRAINVTENTGSDLKNYTIKIQLDSTNFDFNKANPDGSDIRFLDSDNTTLLDYWIEKWDKNNEQAIIWVKIPTISGGSTKKIYMLYGNPSASIDTAHYGLTRVMEKLPANDGSNYQIQYEVWDTGTQLFDSTQGTAMGWHGDDSRWSYTLPFSFPYYNSSYTSIYICSNGFIGTTYSGTDYSSTINELKSRGMIAPFWADLRTQYDSHDIFINASYIDVLGRGVYIRWYTTFYSNSGNQNFAAILYENGLIRFDYGGISGSSSTDGTPVIGVSLGDGTHYTLLVTDNNEPASNWDNHDSLYLWPRKVASTEPSVAIGEEQTNLIQAYGISITYWWTGVTPELVEVMVSSTSVHPAVTPEYRLSENSTGAWMLFYEGNSLPSTIEVKKYYSSGSVGIGINATSNQPFNFTVNSMYIQGRVLDTASPILGIAVNGSTTLYFKDIIDNDWFTIDTGGELYNPYISFSYGNMTFLILNGSNILSFDPYEKRLYTVMNISGVGRDSSFIIPLYNSSNWIIFSPGANNNTIYSYSLETGLLVDSLTLPENVSQYSCTALEESSSGTIGYMMIGGSGNLYNITVNNNGQMNIQHIVLHPSNPTGYPVGLAYGDDLLWVIEKGGGIHSINPTDGSVNPLPVQPPYYPESEGDRLSYYGGYLYHIREDSSSDIWVIKVS